MAAAGAGGGYGSDSGWMAARPCPSVPRGENRLRDPDEAICSACRSGFAAARGLPVEIHHRNPPPEACFSRTEDSGAVLCPDCEIVQIPKTGFQSTLSWLESVKLGDFVSLQSLLPYKEPEKNMAIRYGPPVLPKESAEVSVVVCHVNSPGDFYLQLVEDLDFLLFLKIINDAYKNEYEGENLEILCPVKGQACVARFEDGVLYRAEVLGFPGHREVEVKNVDVGSTTRIALQDICKVKDELLSFPRKAINCRLAHIEPSIRTGPWSREAKEKFEEMISGRFLICSVDRIMEDDVLLVELFLSPHVPGMMANSVNSELVKRGLACYDPGCTPKENPTKHDEIWDPSLEEILLYEAKITGSAVKKPGMDQDAESSVEELLSHGTEVTGSEVKKSMKDQGSELLDIQGLPVQFCHVVSPEEIYFHWFETESLLASLQEEMAAVYEGSNLEPIPWTSGMHCAVLMPQLKQWRRGQITRIISETLVEVFQFDYGVEMEVNVACLRKLKENLMEMGKFAVECCLVDIRPTGGSDRWTATTCDYLSFCLTGAVAKIIIQEKQRNPMPVKILCQDKTGRSFDFSAVLVEKGLALRVKSLLRFPKADKSDLVSEASLAIPLMPVPKNPAVATCLKIFSKSEKEVTGDKASKPAFKPKTVETYKPPVIPSAKFFEAIISWVADDGTVYVIPKSSEPEFTVLMEKMQGIFTSLDLLVPHSWKKEEACVIRGSDSQWYRGVILEIIDSCVKVGNFWSPGAVELLRELLLPKREVKIHNMASPEHPAGMLSVHLYFAGMSLSYFMAHHEHCTLEGSEDGLTSDIENRSENSVEEYWKISFEELHRPETKIRVLPPYSLLSLPLPGELFFVQVRHLVVPNEVYVCPEHGDGSSHDQGTEERKISWKSEPESLEEGLQHCNLSASSLPFLTDFKTDMPCLAQYSDGLWYRGKIISANGFDPLTVLVQFVDYGMWQKLPAGRLRQIPDSLMQYPAQAAKVTLTGFKPPKSDLEKVRIPYCPSWSMEAVWSMVDLLQGKRLQALTLTQTPEPMVLLFDDEQNPVYRPLVDMGLADLDE